MRHLSRICGCIYWSVFRGPRAAVGAPKVSRNLCVLGIGLSLFVLLLECFIATRGGNDVHIQNASSQHGNGYFAKRERYNVRNHKANALNPWMQHEYTKKPNYFVSPRTLSTNYNVKSEGHDAANRRAQLQLAKYTRLHQTGSAGKVQRTWGKVYRMGRLVNDTDARWDRNKTLLGIRQNDNSVQRAASHLLRFRALDTGMGFSELPVTRTARATQGEPWPYPQSYRVDDTNTQYVIDVRHLQYVTEYQQATCDVIELGLGRFRLLIEDMRKEALTSPRGPVYRDPSWRLLSNIQISVVHRCDRYPTLESDESYEILIKNRTLHLRASEAWGALYGLQTISQIILKSKGHLLIKDVRITDFPRFKHRGIMLDTGRHYLSKDVIRKNLDAMAMNKMNVFHWHLVDDQSFPFKSQTFPQLSERGAYAKWAVYTHDDIKDIIEYARLRGIRVIPELDTPGHVESWYGLSELLTPCGSSFHHGPIDPSRNSTYTTLVRLFREILDLFPSSSMHFGGDECSYYCWSRNINVTHFMKSKNIEKDFKALFNYYFTRLQSETQKSLGNKLKTSIYWQEVFDEGVKLKKESIIHIWKDNYLPKLTDVTRAGHRVVLSSCWYLNYIKYGKDWPDYYMCDPQGFAGSRSQKEMVIGGEACMWGEYADDINLLSDLWPRASAVAERLWSSQSRSNPYIAEGRFEENRCRMVKRGIPARSIGPGPPCMHGGST